MFVISKNSLNRGSLNRGSTVCVNVFAFSIPSTKPHASDPVFLLVSSDCAAACLLCNAAHKLSRPRGFNGALQVSCTNLVQTKIKKKIILSLKSLLAWSRKALKHVHHSAE